MANLSRETLQRLHKEFMPYAKMVEGNDALRAKYPDVNEAFKQGNAKTGAQYQQEFYNERLGQHPSASGLHNPLTYVHVMLDKQRKAEAKKALIAQIAGQQKQEMLDNGSYRYDMDMGKAKADADNAPRPDPNSFDRKDLERNDRMHNNAMRGGDDTLSYTETGDIVIPRRAAEANPGLAMAAMNVLAQMGANPQQYVAGSPEGSYNPDTGAQEFAWYTDLMKWGTKAADYVGSHDWAKSAATGALTYGGSKLMGNDSKTAKYQALGAGLGTYGGLKFDQKFGKDVKPYSMTTEASGDGGTFTPQDLYGALKEAAGSVGKAGAKAGALGAGIGTMLAPAPPAFSPDLNIGPVVPMGLGAVKPMAEFRKEFAQNEQPNLSDTLSKPAPVAPIMPMPMMPEGVTYQNQVRDRNTGEYRYERADNPADQSAFARAIKGASRRRGYGNMILV